MGFVFFVKVRAPATMDGHTALIINQSKLLHVITDHS